MKKYITRASVEFNFLKRSFIQSRMDIASFLKLVTEERIAEDELFELVQEVELMKEDIEYLERKFLNKKEI